MPILDALKPLTAVLFPPVCDACGAGMSAGPVLGPCAACEAVLRTFEPPFCAGCGCTVASEGRVCASCAGRPIYQDLTLACLRYTDQARRLMHAYKFGRRRALTDYFARRGLWTLRRHAAAESFDGVLAAPSSARRDYRRGYAPAALVAAGIARIMGWPYLQRPLSRLDGGRPQSLLGRRERLSGSTLRFAVTPETHPKNLRLLLVDDILTTGQTASDCARALKEAGAERVVVLALTRGVLRS